MMELFKGYEDDMLWKGVEGTRPLVTTKMTEILKRKGSYSILTLVGQL